MQLRGVVDLALGVIVGLKRGDPARAGPFLPAPDINCGYEACDDDERSAAEIGGSRRVSLNETADLPSERADHIPHLLHEVVHACPPLTPARGYLLKG
jgi:hypothetical protein